MKIIAFLGNTGKKYSKNRHNAGFIIGDIFADQFNIRIKNKNFHSDCGSGAVKGIECLLLFPRTYMNNSGLAINTAMQYYNESPENLIVVHDEIELSFGKTNVKSDGGHKGHNGIRSIMQHIGTPEFRRVRIGVGRSPDPQIKVADYLLSNFSKEEFNQLIELAPEIIEIIIKEIMR